MPMGIQLEITQSRVTVQNQRNVLESEPEPVHKTPVQMTTAELLVLFK